MHIGQRFLACSSPRAPHPAAALRRQSHQQCLSRGQRTGCGLVITLQVSAQAVASAQGTRKADHQSPESTG